MHIQNRKWCLHSQYSSLHHHSCSLDCWSHHYRNHCRPMQHYHNQELRKKLICVSIRQGDLDYFIIYRIISIFFYKNNCQTMQHYHNMELKILVCEISTKWNNQWDWDAFRHRYTIEFLILVSKIVLLKIILLGFAPFLCWWAKNVQVSMSEFMNCW